jgi:uncharacterized 2Fe-2S/4Fe-4S cluster protein (DUF4445 family)
MTTRPKAATVGVGRQVILRPAVQKRYLELSEPTLQDQRPDIQRVLDVIDDFELKVEFSVLQKLPKILRSANFKLTAVIVDDTLIDLEPGDTSSIKFGIAFDLGTTTVVATLLDLETGTPAAVKSMLNKQQPFGADVISRISATMLDETALDKLRLAAQNTLSELANEVCETANIEPVNVYEISVAGNATMIQLALGVDPEPVGVAPFITASQHWPILLASEYGVQINPNAKAYTFPSLGAYVGGDIVAGVLATGMDRDKRVRLFIDVGTNCEIVLSSGDTILTTAAPAGPAFEAASIKCGMRAAEGAIEVIKINQGAVEIQVIGEVQPVGICGSGLVDAVSELVKIGFLDSSGRFVDDDSALKIQPNLASKLMTLENGERIFVLHGDASEPLVYLTQRDVRELQFAKASIATGWKILLEQLEIQESEIQQVLLAGSFGSYLSPASAVNIGLVPKLPILRILSAGNVAGEGAKMALLSQSERKGAETVIEEIEYVELSDRSDFNDKFIEQLAFPL